MRHGIKKVRFEREDLNKVEQLAKIVQKKTVESLQDLASGGQVIRVFDEARYLKNLDRPEHKGLIR